jgi:hypothetical protein
MKTISNTNIFSLLLLCFGGDINCFVATAAFYKKIEDDIIITRNVNNNKTIKRGLDFCGGKYFRRSVS